MTAPSPERSPFAAIRGPAIGIHPEFSLSGDSGRAGPAVAPAGAALTTSCRTGSDPPAAGGPPSAKGGAGPAQTAALARHSAGGGNLVTPPFALPVSIAGSGAEGSSSPAVMAAAASGAVGSAPATGGASHHASGSAAPAMPAISAPPLSSSWISFRAITSTCAPEGLF